MADKEKETLEEVETKEASTETEEIKADSQKQQVEKKIRKQIEKKQEKEAHGGISRIAEYLKEEHKWESYVFIAVSLITLALGLLILNGSLAIKSGFPLIGSYPNLFAWILVVLASLGLIYALWPFFKPALPEFKKITWLTMPKFLGNLIRVFVFMLVFVGVLYLYDAFMSEIFVLIFS